MNNVLVKFSCVINIGNIWSNFVFLIQKCQGLVIKHVINNWEYNLQFREVNIHHRPHKDANNYPKPNSNTKCLLCFSNFVRIFRHFFDSGKKKTSKKKEDSNKRSIINIFNPKAASRDYYSGPKKKKSGHHPRKKGSNKKKYWIMYCQIFLCY